MILSYSQIQYMNVLPIYLNRLTEKKLFKYLYLLYSFAQNQIYNLLT